MEGVNSEDVSRIVDSDVDVVGEGGGSKTVSGWQISDFVALGGAFSSCIILVDLWEMVGLSLGTFDGAGDILVIWYEVI